MFHNSKAVAALSKEPNETVYQKTLGAERLLPRATGRGRRSATSRCSASPTPGAMRGEEPKLTKLAPNWTLEQVARHSVDLWLTTEDLPMPDNRVTVDSDGNIHLAYEFSNAAETDGLYRELKTVLNRRRPVGAPRAVEELLRGA